MIRSIWSKGIVLATTVVLTFLLGVALTINGIGFRPIF